MISLTMLYSLSPQPKYHDFLEPFFFFSSFSYVLALLACMSKDRSARYPWIYVVLVRVDGFNNVQLVKVILASNFAFDILQELAVTLGPSKFNAIQHRRLSGRYR